MIRGALILGLGFALGYGKAMHEVEEIREFAREAREFLALISEEVTKTVEEDDIVDEDDVDVVVDTEAIEVTTNPTTEGETRG